MSAVFCGPGCHRFGGTKMVAPSLGGVVGSTAPDGSQWFSPLRWDCRSFLQLLVESLEDGPLCMQFLAFCSSCLAFWETESCKTGQAWWLPCTTQEVPCTGCCFNPKLSLPLTSGTKSHFWCYWFWRGSPGAQGSPAACHAPGWGQRCGLGWGVRGVLQGGGRVGALAWGSLQVDGGALSWGSSAGRTVRRPANVPGRVNFASADRQEDLGIWIQIARDVLSLIWFQALVLVLPVVKVFVEEGRVLWCCLTAVFWLPMVPKKVKRDKSVLILLSLWFRPARPEN